MRTLLALSLIAVALSNALVLRDLVYHAQPADMEESALRQCNGPICPGNNGTWCCPFSDAVCCSTPDYCARPDGQCPPDPVTTTSKTLLV